MIYLDHNATTAPAPAVLEAMTIALREAWANPSSPHAAGQGARRVLMQARAACARVLGCKTSELLFTSGATEANHLALRGLLAAAQAKTSASPVPLRVVFSSVEHAGLLRFAQMLAAQGVQVDLIPVLADGRLDLQAAARLIASGVNVVSLMAANNETGALMPVTEIAALARDADARLHVDATQWIGKLPFDFASCGADAVTLSAHKFHGPKGVGALLLRHGTPFESPTPGSQERGRRGGTENLPGIVGMAAALDALGDATAMMAEAERQAALRDALEAGLQSALPQLHVWAQGVPRLPGTSCLRVGDLPAEATLQRLERMGVAASSGAACSSGGSEPSHVLRAMGVPDTEALAAVRLSLGRSTDAAQVQQIVRHLPDLLRPLLEEQAQPA